MHTALALETTRVECGALVYSIGYRHPAVLAKAITAIDLLSNGRAAMGIGAGWAEVEYRAYGIEFPNVGVRMDQLEEGVAVLRGLLHDPVTSFQGDWFTLVEARNEPRPVQAKLPIWVGGSGERRTLRIAARFADGWNIPFVAPETFAHKREVLHRHCDEVGRDPGAIRCAVNLGLAWTDDEPPRAIRPDRRLRASGCARRLRRRGARPRRRLRGGGRRSGEPGAAGALRRRSARALQRRVRPQTATDTSA